MVILISDLHLADTVEAAPLQLTLLLQQLRGTVIRAVECGIKSVHLVLLGDIFELLRSKQWLLREVRPWETCTEKHIDAVDSIFNGVIDNNREFFDGLNELKRTANATLQLEYIPGNHDRVINTEMGIGARANLRRLIEFASSGGEFQHHFINKEHSLIATHGHQWDPLNRYSPRGAAIGDAIVIEMLVKLPRVFIRKLGIEESDADVAFLQELDNVRPQHPNVIAKWIRRGLKKMSTVHPNVLTIFHESCNEIIESLKSLRKESKKHDINFESFETASLWMNVLTNVMFSVVSNLGTLNTLELLPFVGNDTDLVGRLAANDLLNLDAVGFHYDYIVSGHTHYPVIMPFHGGTDKDKPRLYFNTGTWRRVHRIGSTIAGDGDANYFTSSDNQCVVSIFSSEEQTTFGAPAYDFYRLCRGVSE